MGFHAFAQVFVKHLEFIHDIVGSMEGWFDGLKPFPVVVDSKVLKKCEVLLG